MKKDLVELTKEFKELDDLTEKLKKRILISYFHTYYTSKQDLIIDTKNELDRIKRGYLNILNKYISIYDILLYNQK